MKENQIKNDYLNFDRLFDNISGALNPSVSLGNSYANTNALDYRHRNRYPQSQIMINNDCGYDNLMHARLHLNRK